MANFIRVRRLHRMPCRLGKTAISNTLDGTVIDLDDVAINADLRRIAPGRLVQVDWNAHQRNATSPGVQANLEPIQVTNDISAANTWSASAGGFERIFAVDLPGNFKISSLSFTSGATAAGTPTHQWATIATGTATTLTYVAVSADLLTAAWAANSVQTFTLGSAYTTPKPGTYYLSVMALATTAPSLVGRSVVSAAMANLNVASPLTKATGTSSTARTTPPAVAATLAFSTVAADGQVPYVTYA